MVLASILWLGTSVSSQGVTADVYPSEDELLEALQLGEIDPVQYERLREILWVESDSLTEAAIDDIPDIDAVLRLFGLTRDDLLPLRPHQAAPVSRESRPTASLVHRYEKRTTENGESRYHTALDLHLSARWRANLRIDRTFTGRERVVGRSVTYRSRRGTVQAFTLGTHARKLGLGTVAGYRGKLLNCSQALDMESFRYPDYGGANGGYVRLAAGAWQGEARASFGRDGTYRMESSAAMIKRGVGRTTLGGVVGVTRLSNRSSGGEVRQLSSALHLAREYSKGKLAAEISAQAGGRGGFGAAIFEGVHHAGESIVRYDLWYYGGNYLDLTAGSRSGPIGHRDSIEAVGFGFSTRRRGARGGRLRLSSPLNATTSFGSDLLVHAFNADTVRIEYTTALERASRPVGGRLEYRYRFTRRNRGSPGTDSREGRAVAQLDIATGAITGRAYVAHTARENQADYMSLLARLRIETVRCGRIEIGTYLARANIRPIRNDYWSGYVRTAQPLGPSVSAAVRFSHRYSRISSTRYETTITLEVEGGF